MTKTKAEILTDAIGYPKRKDADVREWEHGENVLEAMELYAQQELAAERSRQDEEMIAFTNWIIEGLFMADGPVQKSSPVSNADLLKKYREQNQSK